MSPTTRARAHTQKRLLQGGGSKGHAGGAEWRRDAGGERQGSTRLLPPRVARPASHRRALSPPSRLSWPLVRHRPGVSRPLVRRGVVLVCVVWKELCAGPSLGRFAGRKRVQKPSKSRHESWDCRVAGGPKRERKKNTRNAFCCCAWDVLIAPGCCRHPKGADGRRKQNERRSNMVVVVAPGQAKPSQAQKKWIYASSSVPKRRSAATSGAM